MTVPRYGAVTSSHLIMADEQLAENSVEENDASSSPLEEQNLSEVEDTDVSSEKTGISTEESDTDGKRATGAEKRIHSLVDKVKEKDSVIEDLTTRLAELQGGNVPQGQYDPFTPSDNDGGERELTIEDLRTIARLEVEKERTVNRINAEAADAIREHPVLDKNSPDFDPDVNEAVSTAVWLEIQKDPSKSVKQLTEKYMRPYARAAEKAVGQEKSILARQVSDSALKPVNVKSGDKKAEDMSIEELEKRLEIVY